MPNEGIGLMGVKEYAAAYGCGTTYLEGQQREMYRQDQHSEWDPSIRLTCWQRPGWVFTHYQCKTSRTDQLKAYYVMCRKPPKKQWKSYSWFLPNNRYMMQNATWINLSHQVLQIRKTFLLLFFPKCHFETFFCISGLHSWKVWIARIGFVH